MARLQEKVALITGGASGIGAATVRLFIEERASVVPADIDDDRGRRLTKELGTRVTYVHADVSCEGDIKAPMEATVKRFTRLDCLFNNAGPAQPSGYEGEVRTPSSPLTSIGNSSSTRA